MNVEVDVQGSPFLTVHTVSVDVRKAALNSNSHTDFRRAQELCVNREVSGPGLSFPIPLLECCFTSTETVALLGTGAQDVHLDFHTAPDLCPIP